LTAFAGEPKPPRPVLSLSTVTLESGQQVQAHIALSEKSNANASGQLKLEFQNGAKDDALIFTASGKSTLAYEVHEGDTEVTFDTSSSATFQTGTTSGNLVITAELGGYSDQATMGIAPASVHIDSSTALRGSNTLVVEMNGFDNTRTVSQMVFTFYDQGGTPLPAAPIRLDVSNDFQHWFEQSTLGGMFSLKATFPVTGDPLQISAVKVDFQNGSGTTSTEPVRF